MDYLLDILKITLPAFIVFITVYFLFKQYLNQQYGLELLKFKQNQVGNILPLKLQAFERLMLFCERISLDQLIYRLNHSDMEGKDLQRAMLVAIQQEYEHNLTQQIYVSDNLWQIIKLSKEQMQNVISKGHGDTPARFIEDVSRIFNDTKADPLKFAKSAIKKEAELII